MPAPRRAAPWLVALLSAVCLAGLSCGGPPARVSTHGYRAVASSRAAGQGKVSWELAVRGDDRRKQPADDEQGLIQIARGGLAKAYEVDPKAKTVREVAWGGLDAFWPGHPLGTGFSAAAEAARRGITQYRRESDTVFAGHACQLWSFAENPEDELSPYTTYWVASDLEGLVLRVDRSRRQADGTWVSDTTELVNVRLVAAPDLFEIPKGYRTVNK